MKRILGLLSGLLLCSTLSATTLTGVIKYGDGTPVTGTLTLTPGQQMNVLNTGSCGGPARLTPANPKKVPINAGSPPTGTTVYGNDCISPALTYYNAQLVNNLGSVVFNEFWRITGVSADIGEILPVVNPTGTPLALNGDVTGDVTQSIVQRLQGFPLDATVPIQGQILLFDTGHWKPGAVAGTGTVTSVDFTAPTEFTVLGTPITSAGTIQLGWANQATSTVLAGPTIGSGPPVFRLLAGRDIPEIGQDQVTDLVTDLAALTPQTRRVDAGAGLTGGGDLTVDRTLSIATGGVTDAMMQDGVDTANTPGTIVKRDGSGNFAAGTITGTLTGNATNVSGIVAIVNGGTGASSKPTGFDALSPMSALGDLTYGGAVGTGTRLPGNTTTTKQLLSQTGNGSVSAAPAWAVLLAADIPAIPESGVINLVSDLAARALTSTSVTATAPLTGSGTLGANLTLGISPCAAGGSHTSGAVPDPVASSGRFLKDDCTWATAAGGGGTVTSVGLSLPAFFTVSGSPVTTTGTLTAVMGTQPANFLLAGPTTGSAAAPDFRLLVAADIPALPQSAITNLVSDLAAKVPTARTLTTTSPVNIDGSAQTVDLSANRTISVNSFSISQPGVVAASGSATKFIRGDNTAQDVVTSVAVTMPAEFSVAGSPITSTGTIAVTKAVEAENTVYAGPTVAPSAAPTFRSLVAADIPTIAQTQVTGLVSSLAGKVPATRSLLTTGSLTIDGGSSADLSADRTFALGLYGLGCLQDYPMAGGLGITPACITDAMLSPSTGYLKRDGTTNLTGNWHVGQRNIGVGVDNFSGIVYSLEALGGGMGVIAVQSPGAPAVTPNGVAGSTTYNYQIVAIDHNGGKTLVGPIGTTTTGNATLDSSNFNHITWTPVAGAATYDVTINGTTTSVATNIATAFFDDIGGTQNAYTAPVRNSTADVRIDGLLTTDFNFTSPITVPGTVTTGYFISTVTNPQPPLVVTSTAPVANLTLASDTQLPTISTAGKVSNSATTGTASNTPSTLVLRDGSGNFAAGQITGTSFVGPLTGTATSAVSFTGPLVGDVTGTQGATVVSAVGGSTAANVHAAELLANAATTSNTASTIVRRDASGNFLAGAPSFAGAITSTLSTGTAPLVVASTTAVSNLTLAADSQLPTISTGGKVLNSATTATATNSPSTIVLRDGSGNFAAGAVTLSDQLTSSLAIGTAPLVITSTTPVANLSLAADTQLPTIATAGKVQNSATSGTAAATASTLMLRDGSANVAAAQITGTKFIGPVTAMSVNGGAAQVDFSASPVPATGYVLQALDATHAQWASATSTGSVPTTRTITATAPVRIDGGASADLSANRTLSVAITSVNSGGAVAAQTSSPGLNQATSNFNISGVGLALKYGAGVDFTTNLTAPTAFLEVSGADGAAPGAGYVTAAPQIAIDGDQAHFSIFEFRAKHASAFDPSGLQNGDTVGILKFTGQDDTSWLGLYDASLTTFASEAWTSSAHGTELSLAVTPNGSVGNIEVNRIHNDGSMSVYNGISVGYQAPSVAPATGMALDAGGAVAFHHGSVTLANGLNSNVTTPAFSFVRFSGPTGAYSLGGLTGGIDGRIEYLYFTPNQTATIVNEDVSSTAANRIKTLTGADVVLRTTLPAFGTVIYDATTSRWVLVSVN
jgi:hypothetical protein